MRRAVDNKKDLTLYDAIEHLQTIYVRMVNEPGVEILTEEEEKIVAKECIKELVDAKLVDLDVDFGKK